ncbi:hypothetical protein DASC09_006280 [Saccharomycopsis crataegensis]|uniref:D-xylose 1-dehydrogenase (NADP(+), D-xylono-1,5-lactone-forming) n=1 Tax=Saccharomycopsis crataegensis TaxID=43959 RepID=A0AAV5QEP1_9ASCO|nr:hypothetical protein DASC09_006280 [Saccharomycopsis crataegensis]
MSLPTLRWAVLGTGFISTQFVQDICEEKAAPKANHIISVIGVSTTAKGEKFANEYVVNGQAKPKILSYEEAITDKDVDIVYIGLPHTSHYEWTIKSLEAGKHVLCEKPLAVNRKQSLEMVELARSKKLFLMEAVWTRFFPIILELQKLIHEDKIIGDLNRMVCDFSIDMGLDKLGPESRVKNPKYAGGALLDIGVYTLTFWRLFLDDQFGRDTTKFEVKSFQTIENGIDVVSSAIIKHADGKSAICINSFLNNSPKEMVRIDGEKGTVYIGGDRRLLSEPSWYKIEFKPETGLAPIEKTVSKGAINGLIHEADACAKDIAEGKTESSICPLDETLLVMEVLDEIRAQNGLKFPEIKYE